MLRSLFITVRVVGNDNFFEKVKLLSLAHKYK